MHFTVHNYKSVYIYCQENNPLCPLGVLTGLALTIVFCVGIVELLC